MIVGLFDPKLTTENGIAPAGVDHISSTNVSRRTVPCYAKIDMFVCELDTRYGCFFMDFRAAFSGMIEQHFIEIRSSHLIGMIRFRSKPVLEIKFGSFLGTGSKYFATKFFHEAGT